MATRMMVVTRGRYSPAGLLFVLIVHTIIALLVLRPSPYPEQHAPARYSRLLFIALPPPAPAEKIPEPPRPNAAVNIRRERIVSPIIAAPVAVKPVETPPVADAMPGAMELPPRLNIEDLVKGAGKADRETRTDREMQAYGPAPDSMEAVMTRAFTAAKLAVPLKWYEAARIELFSAPNDPKKIYQVTTAFGIYCLYYPSMYEEVGPRQPRMASCPRRFGRGAK